MTSDHLSVTPEQVEKATARLRPLEREVLFLSARERLSNDEVAARLGITTKVAERLLANALCKLDRALERQGRPWWKFW